MGLLPSWLDTPFAVVVLPIWSPGLLSPLPLISPTGERHILRRPLSMVIAISCTMIWHADLARHLRSVVPGHGRVESHAHARRLSQRANAARNSGRDLDPVQAMPQLSLARRRWTACAARALDNTGTRLTRDESIRQILQGGGNMPAYGKALKPAEVNAIVAFLMTMHPANEPPARDSARPAVPASE